MGEDGEQIGIKLTEEARSMRTRRASTSSKSPRKLTRLSRWGWTTASTAHEEEHKVKLARKHQTQINVKEDQVQAEDRNSRLRTKKGHVVRFLNQRAKVKVTIMFRGREKLHPERGRDLLLRLAEEIKEIGAVESETLLEVGTWPCCWAPQRMQE